MNDIAISDWPVLIPTTEGPVGGVVSVPAGDMRGALVMLPGHGPPARSGTNALWTRMARALAGLGVAVLRIDYAREGETIPIGEGQGGARWKLTIDRSLACQAARWFSREVGGRPLMFAGSCGGARLSIELAGNEFRPAAGIFAIVPYLEVLPQAAEEQEGRATEIRDVDPAMVDRLRTIMESGPAWILVGEHDTFPDIPMLKRMLGPAARHLEVEVAPRQALHYLDHPHIQEQAESRLLARLSRALKENGELSSDSAAIQTRT